MKKRQIKFATGLLAVLLAFVMVVPPVFAARIPERNEEPSYSLSAETYVNAAMEVTQDDEFTISDETSVSNEFAVLNGLINPTPEFTGVFGFDGLYEITDFNEIVEITVQFAVPPAVALRHIERLGMTQQFNDLGNNPVARALSAHDAFAQELGRIGIDAERAIFASNYQLFNGVFMRVPGNMIGQIAELPSVIAVFPNIRFEIPDVDEFEPVILEHVMRTASNVPDFHPDFMRGSRQLFNTDYIHNQMGITGRGVTVAVLDTGLRHDHDVFAHLINPETGMVPGWCFLTNTYNTWEGVGTPHPGWAANDWHGTHVAAGAVAVAPNINLRVYRVLGNHSNSGAFHVLTAGAEAAWESSDIMNLSLGVQAVNDMTTDIFDPLFGPLHVALNLASIDGVVVAQAIGNGGGGTLGSNITSPSSISLSLGVGGQTLGNQFSATGEPASNDDVHAVSSRGPSRAGHIRPDLLAPYNTFAAGSGSPNQYRSAGGTSMSAPQAAGAAALMLEQNPGMNAFEIRARMMNSAVRPADLTIPQISANATGAGRLRPIEALNTTAYAVVYTTVPLGYIAGQGEVWVENPQPMGSLNFGFIEAMESAVLPVVVYDSPSNAGWSYEWAIYSSNIGAVNITNFEGAELVVMQTGANTFNVQMVFSQPATAQNVTQNFTGFFYLTYNGSEDITISMPFAGRMDFMEPHLESFSVNRSEMNLFGGNWVATTNGFFQVPHEYIVYRDGEYFTSGTMTGNARTRTTTIEIPQNNTGIDQVYVMHVPALEGENNYAPQTLLVVGHHPGYARITVMDSTNTNNPNLAAFDSTLEAIGIWSAGDINVYDMFDFHVPNVENWDNWQAYRFVDEGEGYILAGTHQLFWWRWGFGVQIPFWGEYTFTADTHYIIELLTVGHPLWHGLGTYRITVVPEESELHNFTVNRHEMNMFGGNWVAAVEGFFLEDELEYVVYLDGAYFTSGIMTGGLMERTAVIAIPPNETGNNQVFEIRLPFFEGHANYAPQTLIVGGSHPGFAHITVIDSTGNANVNMAAFDSTLEAIGVWDRTNNVNIFNNFDSHVPAIENPDNWTDYRFVDQAEGQIMAGIHQLFWWTWNQWGAQIPFFIEHAFRADGHYIIELQTVGNGNNNGTYRILAAEQHLESFTVNQRTMNMLGGNWIATANGFFDEDVDFVVYRDGEYFTSGIMSGGLLSRTAVIAIPQNDTGIKQVYEIHLPLFEGSANYEPQTLIVNAEVGFAKVTFAIGSPFGTGDGGGYMMLLDSENKPHANNFDNYNIFLPSNAYQGIPIPANGSYSVFIPGGVYAIHTGNWFNNSVWAYDILRWNDFEFAAGYHYHFQRFVSGSDNMILTVTPMQQVYFGAVDDYGGVVTAFSGGNEIQSGDWVDRGSEVTFAANPHLGYEVGTWNMDFLFELGANSNQGRAMPLSVPTTLTLNNLNFDVYIQVEFNRLERWIEEIVIEDHDDEVHQGSSLQFDYTVFDQLGIEYEGDYEVVWTTSNIPGAAINQNGLLTVAANVPVGTEINITASVSDMDIFDTTTVTVAPELLYVYFGEAYGAGGTVTAYVNNIEIQSGNQVPRGSAVTFVATPDPWHFVSGWNIEPLVINEAVNRQAQQTFIINNLQMNLRMQAEFTRTAPFAYEVVIEPFQIEVNQGGSKELSTTVLDQFGDIFNADIVWSVSDIPGVDIDQNGMLTVGLLVPAGTEIAITAAVYGLPDVFDTASLFVMHNPVAYEVVLTPGEVVMPRNSSFDFEAVIYDQWGFVYEGTLLWSATNIPGVAIDQNGRISVALTVPLNTVITVTAAYGELYAEAAVTLEAANFTVIFGDNSPGGTITVTANGNAIISGDGLPEGTTLVATATPDIGFMFAGWDIDLFSFGVNMHSFSITINNLVSDLHINAHFIPNDSGPVLTLLDFNALNEAIADGQAIEAFGPNSIPRVLWTSFRNALTEAMAIRDNINATQVQVDAAANILRGAINNLSN